MKVIAQTHQAVNEAVSVYHSSSQMAASGGLRAFVKFDKKFF